MLSAILLVIVVALSIYLRFWNRRYPFLELFCNAWAAVFFVFALIDLLPSPQLPRLILSAVLTLGCAVYAVTELLLLRAGRGTAKAPCECIIVLGCKIIEGEPSVSLTDRIRAAGDYLRCNPETVAVLSGGQCEGEPMAEAQFMFDRLTEMGIDPNRLLMECHSLNTWENLRFSTKLIKDKFGEIPENIGLLSSEYHLFRATMHAKRQGLQVLTIPARTGHFLTKLNGYLREGAGVWHQLILGGTYHERTEIC